METSTIGLSEAMDQQSQMTLYRVLLLTWYGVMQFALRAILRMVERIITGLRRTIVLRPIARLFKKVAKWLRGLICWSEKQMYGRPISGFCKKKKPDRELGFEDSQDQEIDAVRKQCFTTDSEGATIATIPGVADCLEDDSGSEPPTGTGCPVVIPPECVQSAETIVRAVGEWALNHPGTRGPVNPAAFLLYPVVQHMIDLHDTGLFLLTSQDRSELTDELAQRLKGRPASRNRWGHPLVTDFIDRVPSGRVTYTRMDPVTGSRVLERGCD